MGGQVYLDLAASEPLLPAVAERVRSMLGTYGNPSSAHSAGRAAREAVEGARDAVAGFVGAAAREVYFTPGGAASNTMAIRGWAARNHGPVLYSPIAHRSLVDCARATGRGIPLRVGRDGMIDMEALRRQLGACQAPPLVAVDYANSEIGTVQDAAAISAATHSHGGTVYLDCTGLVPQIPLDMRGVGADICGFSGHKLGALKGCGVLAKKDGVEIEPLVYGAQERGLVGGTENVVGIASLAAAIGCLDYGGVSPWARDYAYERLSSEIPGCGLAGPRPPRRLPLHLGLCFRGVEGESLAMILDMEGVLVSTGSACESGSGEAPRALREIGVPEGEAAGFVRLTFSGREKKGELDYACGRIAAAVAALRSMGRDSDEWRA